MSHQPLAEDIAELSYQILELANRRRAIQTGSAKVDGVPRIAPRDVSSDSPELRTVYISYAWEDQSGSDTEDKSLVERLQESLMRAGFEVRLDKGSIGYRESITQYMAALGRGANIVAIISARYLQSKNCMHELVEIWRNNNLSKRLRPIVMRDAKIHTFDERVRLISYWTDQLEEATAKMSSLRRDHLSIEGVQSTYNDLRRIAQNVDSLVGILADMNTYTPEALEAGDFAVIKRTLDS